jgi:hypothetical protein
LPAQRILDVIIPDDVLRGINTVAAVISVTIGSEALGDFLLRGPG